MSDIPLIGTKTVKPGTFQPGNPGGGRPKMPDDLKEALRNITRESLPALRKIAMGEDERAKPADQLKAIEMAWDRAYGKPIQAVEADVNMTRPIVTPKELFDLIEEGK